MRPGTVAACLCFCFSRGKAKWASRLLAFFLKRVQGGPGAWRRLWRVMASARSGDEWERREGSYSPSATRGARLSISSYFGFQFPTRRFSHTGLGNGCGIPCCTG